MKAKKKLHLHFDIHQVMKPVGGAKIPLLVDFLRRPLASSPDERQNLKF